jgi:hypothetical protein
MDKKVGMKKKWDQEKVDAFLKFTTEKFKNPGSHIKSEHHGKYLVSLAIKSKNRILPTYLLFPSFFFLTRKKDYFLFTPGKPTTFSRPVIKGFYFSFYFLFYNKLARFLLVSP